MDKNWIAGGLTDTYDWYRDFGVIAFEIPKSDVLMKYLVRIIKGERRVIFQSFDDDNLKAEAEKIVGKMGGLE